MEQAVNSFDGGMVLDFNPLQTSNEVLTKALNATLVTMNGNERVLQNDWGNARVESAFLPAGYVPVGVKEHGGIIYVASHNPLTNRSQIGSFPSPERNLGDISTDDDITFGDNDTNKDILYEAELLFDGAVIHPGDKFSLTFNTSSDLQHINNTLPDPQYISNWDNIVDIVNVVDDVDKNIHKAYSPQNSIFTYKLFIEDSGNNLIDITDKLKRYEIIEGDNDVKYAKEITTWPDNVSVEYKFNKGYFIKAYKVYEDNQSEWDSSQRQLMEYRLKTSNYNTYNSKISGKMFLVRQTNSIDHISVNVKGVKINNNTELKLIFYITYYYNCPDKSPYINSNKNLGWVVPAGNQYPYYDSTTNLYKYTIQYIISGIPLNGDTLDENILDRVQEDSNPEYADVDPTQYINPSVYPFVPYNNREKYIPNDDSSLYYVDYDGYYKSKDSDDYNEKYNFGIIEGCELKLKNKLKDGQSTSILEYSITPYIGYEDSNNTPEEHTLDEIALTNLRVEGSLDISLIGSNTLDLNYWQYKWQDSRLTLRTGFKDYLDDDENNKLTKIRIYYKKIIPQFNINDDRDSCPKLEISNINEISDRTDEIAGLDSNYIYKCWIYGVFSSGEERNFGESYFLTCDLHNSLYDGSYRNYYSDRGTLRTDLKLDMTAILDIDKSSINFDDSPSQLNKLVSGEADYDTYVTQKGRTPEHEYWKWERIGRISDGYYNFIPKNKESYPYNSFNSVTKQVTEGEFNQVKTIEIIYNQLLKKIRTECKSITASDLYSYFSAAPISINIGTSDTNLYFSFARGGLGLDGYKPYKFDQGNQSYQALNNFILNDKNNPIAQALMSNEALHYTEIQDQDSITESLDINDQSSDTASISPRDYPYILIFPFKNYLSRTRQNEQETWTYNDAEKNIKYGQTTITNGNWMGILITNSNFNSYVYMPFIKLNESNMDFYSILKEYINKVFNGNLYYPQARYSTPFEKTVKVRNIKDIYDDSFTNINVAESDYSRELITNAPIGINYKFTSYENITQNLDLNVDNIYDTFINKINTWASDETGHSIDEIFYSDSIGTIEDKCFIFNNILESIRKLELKWEEINNERILMSDSTSTSNTIEIGTANGQYQYSMIGDGIPYVNINNNQLVYGDND